MEFRLRISLRLIDRGFAGEAYGSFGASSCLRGKWAVQGSNLRPWGKGVRNV
jgi:hypothetical protein